MDHFCLKQCLIRTCLQTGYPITCFSRATQKTLKGELCPQLYTCAAVMCLVVSLYDVVLYCQIQKLKVH